MSTDFQLGFACPHLIIEERVMLGDDRRSLETQSPIGASADFLTITFNDTIVIPQEGFFSTAQLTGSLSGPFIIRKNLNRFTVTNSKGGIFDFALPVGTRVGADEIVRLLNAQRRNQNIGIIPENINGVLRFSDIDALGGDSRIMVSGDAVPQIGFVNQVAARGRQVCPAWDFAEREDIVNTVNINQFVKITTRFIKFREPLKIDPVIKVTYPTEQTRCRRCRTVGFENDLRFSVQGEVLEIRNEDVLNQSLLKIITTERGSNPFHPFYGTALHDRIGIKAVGASATTIQEDVFRAIEVFKRLQEIQGQFQNLTSRERLFNVLSLSVNPSPIDPTVYKIEILATNASGRQVSVSTVFAAPGSAALVGTNGLSLGLAPEPEGN